MILGLLCGIVALMIGLIAQAVAINNLQKQVDSLSHRQDTQINDVDSIRALVNEHARKLAKAETKFTKVEAKLNDKPDKHVVIRTDKGYLKDTGALLVVGLAISRSFGANTDGYFTSDRSKAKRIVPSNVKAVAQELGTTHYITEPVEEKR